MFQLLKYRLVQGEPLLHARTRGICTLQNSFVFLEQIRDFLVVSFLFPRTPDDIRFFNLPGLCVVGLWFVLFLLHWRWCWVFFRTRNDGRDIDAALPTGMQDSPIKDHPRPSITRKTETIQCSWLCELGWHIVSSGDFLDFLHIGYMVRLLTSPIGFSLVQVKDLHILAIHSLDDGMLIPKYPEFFP